MGFEICVWIPFLFLNLVSGSILPPQNPPWPPTYNMSLSTLSMQCNSSGWSSPSRGAEFGIISYDWSNAKAQWAASKPMDCVERLTEQATMTKSLNPSSKVFTYRNLVKALPWFKEVREKLDDPNYSGFFLKFGNKTETHVPRCAAENPKKCSIFYHDQEQTPAVPTPKQPNPDGSCVDYCDCGTQPCGEYLWDHRNGTMLLDFLLNVHIAGPDGLGNPNIDGFFIDDFWCSNLLNKERGLGPCNDPVQGPTEVDANNQADMALSDEDIKELTLAWEDNMGAAQKKILELGGYTWSLIPGQSNANASPLLLNKENCETLLKQACQKESQWQKLPLLFGLTVNGTNILQLKEDMAFFLLARGPYAWLGWGVWGMTWPFNPEPAHGGLPPSPHGVPRPDIIDQDYGEPLGICVEEETGVFRRKWSKAVVEMNCKNFKGSISIMNKHSFESTKKLLKIDYFFKKS